MENASADSVNLLIVILGLIVGSFLNVVVVRLPHRQSIVWPGSQCPQCKTAIRWHDNLPVLSYLILRGKCRACQVKISMRYPVIELLTALVFLAAKLRFGMSWELILRDLPFLATLIAVAFIDLEHRIIPDELSLGGLGWGLVTTVAFIFIPSGSTGTSIGWMASFIGGAVGFGFFYGLAWTYWRFTGRSGLGGGDIKLLAMMGAFLGVGGVFATILISSVFGSVVGIGLALAQRRKQAREDSQSDSLMLTSIPYGPFLVVGGLYYYFLGNILWFQFTTPM